MPNPPAEQPDPPLTTNDPETTCGDPVRIDAPKTEHRLTLAEPRRTDGAARVGFVLCNALYYGLARHLPFSVRPYSFGARWIRYQVCRHMFRSCGANVNIERGALINGGDEIDIGENSGIGLNAFILGPLIVGRNVMMGPNCTLLGSNHRIDRMDIPLNEQGDVDDVPPVIEDDVWLGANVTVLPGRRIGTGAVVGAGAVVTRDVPAYAIVGGNPARVLGRRG
jgi:maltose O-acetyltransferase